MTEKIRINKYLADQGYCSRREADALIDQGAVIVNSKQAVIGQKVTETDSIVVNKDSLKPLVYLAYYKGRGIITHSPDKTKNELDIITQLKKQIESRGSNHLLFDGVHPVGRLDKDSEGLLLLTNDGRITKPLLSPEAGREKEYEVTVDKPITKNFLRQLEHGVNIEGYRTKPARAKQKSPQRFLLTLTEGKKHQIRRMCAALGYQVRSLKRVRIMHIKLGQLKPNQYRKLTKEETQVLLCELGI